MEASDRLLTLEEASHGVVDSLYAFKYTTFFMNVNRQKTAPRGRRNVCGTGERVPCSAHAEMCILLISWQANICDIKCKCWESIAQGGLPLISYEWEDCVAWMSMKLQCLSLRLWLWLLRHWTSSNRHLIWWKNKARPKCQGDSIYFFRLPHGWFFVTQVPCTPLTRTKTYNFVTQKAMF